MKKFNYKEETMFFLWDNYKVVDFGNKITEYFKKKYKIVTECEGIDKEYINIKFIINDNYVLISFKYDESLFYNCYKTDGVYECEKYVGTRAVIHKLITYLFDDYLLITKKEPLLCYNCGKVTGVVFNDYEADEKSICAGGCIDDDPKQLYGCYEEGINKCYKCGEYFCDNCSSNTYDYDEEFVCEDCQEDDFCEDDIEYGEDIIDKWGNCQFDNDDENKPDCCEECEQYEDCLFDAQDNRDGYSSFCDIVSDAYGSVDAFWECNGI